MAPQVPPGLCKNLLANGTFIAGRDVVLVQMQLRACHENAAKLARRKGVELWTGFGLEGGVWRVHSWCVEAKRILETTLVHELYYGVPVHKPFHEFLLKLKSKRHKAEVKAKSDPQVIS